MAAVKVIFGSFITNDLPNTSKGWRVATRSAPDQGQHQVLREDLPQQVATGSSESLAQADLLPPFLHGRLYHAGQVQRRYQQEERRNAPDSAMNVCQSTLFQALLPMAESTCESAPAGKFTL